MLKHFISLLFLRASLLCTIFFHVSKTLKRYCILTMTQPNDFILLKALRLLNDTTESIQPILKRVQQYLGHETRGQNWPWSLSGKGGITLFLQSIRSILANCACLQADRTFLRVLCSLVTKQFGKMQMLASRLSETACVCLHPPQLVCDVTRRACQWVGIGK